MAEVDSAGACGKARLRWQAGQFIVALEDARWRRAARRPAGARRAVPQA
jgi:hypothetical protein